LESEHPSVALRLEPLAVPEVVLLEALLEVQLLEALLLGVQLLAALPLRGLLSHLRLRLQTI
jgi:hypothetical protein